MKERKQLKRLIKKLPSLKDAEAPLGYSFFQFEYFTDNSKGQDYANRLFSYLYSGTLN